MDPTLAAEPWFQAACVTGVLFLIGLLPLVIHPTLRKDHKRRNAYLAMLLVLTAAISLLGLSPWPVLAAFPMFPYLVLVPIWTITATAARYRKHKLTRNINREIKARQK